MLGDPLEEDLLLSSTEDGEKLRKKIKRSEKKEQGQNRIFKKTWVITGTTRKHRNPLTQVKVLQKTKLCPKCPGRSESNNVSYYGNYLQDLLTVRNSFHSLILRYFKSLRHYLTRDVLPAESNYRNLLSLGRQNSQDVSRKFSRPTLDELHDENGEVMQSLLAKAKIAPKVNFS